MRAAGLITTREDCLGLCHCLIRTARTFYVEWVTALVVPADEARITVIGACAVLIAATEGSATRIWWLAGSVTSIDGETTLAVIAGEIACALSIATTVTIAALDGVATNTRVRRWRWSRCRGRIWIVS
ncbi:MAG: hypothetical protein COU68_02270 [Candidatus Pacebacteria bacterium CG10_big_fil_rev_8_21_14_0_10_45_6]|nr:MAG: hypothetical protein COU68_02270 [Candidatus Pacebacteria bacterium CG10_big_fil_rev_8_21_14_0_10_45_6]